LPHRRDQRRDRRPLVWSQEEITEDIAARVILPFAHFEIAFQELEV